MQPLRALRLSIVTLLAFGICVPALAASQSFTVRNIEVNGLQRISAGTVYTYLPISIGDTVDAERIANAARALYDTGFFSDISLRRSRHTLIVNVEERPSIAHLKITGNQLIKTQKLAKPLKKIGVWRGRIFDPYAVNKVASLLKSVYIGHGKYNVRVNIKVDPIGKNRVDIVVDISEGVDTTIRSINIVGNRIFDDSTLLNNFKLSESHWYMFLSDSDKYVSQKLAGDLEELRSFYMDRGYADFHINSVQVTLSPDYKHVYITINVHEGKIYRVTDVQLRGHFVVPKSKFKELVKTSVGSRFSMRVAQQSAQLMTNLLGRHGFAFADVRPVPKLNAKENAVKLIYYIKPGNRTYVRHVTFTGMPDTDAMVFRRKVRVTEGGWLTNRALKLSEFHLKRIPFVKNVKEDTEQIAGRSGLVDVHYQLTPKRAGRFMFGVGYSSFYGVGINASIRHYNFLGEGNIVALQVHDNQVGRAYSASWTNPHATINGVARTISAHYSSGQALLLNASPITTKRYGLSLSYAIPMSEFDNFFIGGRVNHNNLLTSYYNSSLTYLLFASDPRNGDTYLTAFGPAVEYTQYGVTLGLEHNSINKRIFATAGNRQRLSLTVALPFSDVEYYSLSFSTTDFVPLGGGFIYLLDGRIAFNKPYGGTARVPPRRRLFVGGPSSVRVYKPGYLGPLDIHGNPKGGNFAIYAQNELVIPLPGSSNKSQSSFRLSLFWDFGRAFNRIGDFDFGQIRSSVGVSVQMFAPIGLIRISYGKALDDVPSYMVQNFQFTVGRRF